MVRQLIDIGQECPVFTLGLRVSLGSLKVLRLSESLGYPWEVRNPCWVQASKDAKRSLIVDGVPVQGHLYRRNRKLSCQYIPSSPWDFIEVDFAEIEARMYALLAIPAGMIRSDDGKRRSTFR